MLSKEQITERLLTVVATRRNMFVNCLKAERAVGRMDDATLVAQIFCYCEVLGDAHYDPMLHELTVLEPTPTSDRPRPQTERLEERS